MFDQCRPNINFHFMPFLHNCLLMTIDTFWSCHLAAWNNPLCLKTSGKLIAKLKSQKASHSSAWVLAGWSCKALSLKSSINTSKNKHLQIITWFFTQFLLKILLFGLGGGPVLPRCSKVSRIWFYNTFCSLSESHEFFHSPTKTLIWFRWYPHRYSRRLSFLSRTCSSTFFL